MDVKSLSDKSLLAHTFSLAQKEREILMSILNHLREIDRRKLYAELQCSSLFDYCVKVLKYSEGQASRRVSAARLLREIPQISKHIESGEINLTQLNQAKSFFHEMQIQKPSEKVDIILKLSGKSTRESEKMLWEMKSDDAPKRVTITLKEESYEQLKKVQGLKSHKAVDMDSLILLMCDEVLKIWDPTVTKRQGKGSQPQSRYISAALKATVWKKDSGKCRNCGGKSRLEIDHIKPFALGGLSIQENLRLLCRNCNQRAGINIFGQREEIRARV